MFYQPSQRSKRNAINKSLATNISSDQQLPLIGYQRHKYNKSKTEANDAMNTDSLQSFQSQLNSMMKSIKNKRQNKKRSFLPSVQNLETRRLKSSRQKQQVNQIRNQMSQLKRVVEKQLSNSHQHKNNIQDKLERIVINLQNQRQLLKIETEKAFRSQSNSNYSPQHPLSQTPQLQLQPQPIIIPTPQYLYPPSPYYQTPYYSNRTNRHRGKKWKNSPESQQSDEQVLTPKKKSTTQVFKKKGFESVRKTKFKTPRKKTRLRIYFLTVAYFIFLRAQAKKSALARRKNLQVNCKQDFFKHVGNLKNWLLDAHKYSFSILLEKKNLNFVYFSDESKRLVKQKQNLIMKIVVIGITTLLQNTKPDKISIFVQVLSNLCLHRCFPINNFWTQYQMDQLCVSQTYGFLKIDSGLQKFLICLLVFIKIFIFNMLLQPYKFDISNFPKNQQPTTTNLKIISSVYYLMLKQLIFQYVNQTRDLKYFKIGNYTLAKFAKAKCSQPLIYGNGKEQSNEYISGLFQEDQLYQLKEHDDWNKCVFSLKQIIEKLHQQAHKYRKLTNKKKR